MNESITREEASEQFTEVVASEVKQDMSDLRQDYGFVGDAFSNTVDRSWFEIYQEWFEQAVVAGQHEPNAMVLATVDQFQAPRTRTVLAKEVNTQGVVFFTNYISVKGKHLLLNANASVTFLWLTINKQVSFSGRAVKIDRESSVRYWNKRPRESQIGAWSSQQSQVMNNVEELNVAYLETEKRFTNFEQIPIPPNWGGFLLQPSRVEFWSGKTGRMHDRLEFRIEDEIENKWKTYRLQP